MEDQTLRRLSKKVFPYIWLRHKLMPPVSSHGLFSFSEMTFFSQEIGKTVIIYLHMYRPVLSKYFEKHISSMPHSKKQFWTHVAFLCLQVRLTHDHVFDYFLTVCSVTAEVALHCYVNRYEDVLPFASAFLCAFFETELYEGFHGAGGWVELHRYIQSTFCPELYELVDHHVRKIESPSDHLPILISIEREKLAAERRKKFLSIQSEKIGKIESDEQTKLLVSGIFHWDFMENQRISEIRPGILRRMENIRHKKKKPVISLNEGRNEEPLEADNVMVTKNELSDADKLLCNFEAAGPSESVASICEEQSNHKSGQILNELKYSSLNEVRDEKPLEADNLKLSKNELSDADKLLCEFEEAGSSESVLSMCEERSNQKSGQTLNELKYTEVSKKMDDSELYGKYKGNSRPSSNFYESTSSPTQTEKENSKSFGNNNATIDGLKQSTIKGMPNEKVRNCERYPKFVPHSIENSRTMPKTENVTPETVIEIADSFRHNPLSEVSKTFQKLGFSCLCVGNSSRHDEKCNALTNYSEIMDQCHYFQNKYSSIQFAFLIPNEYFNEKTSQVSTTESYDKTSFEEQYNEQLIPIKEKKDFEYGSDTLQRHQSETHKTRFRVTKVNENQFSFQNEPQLIQNCKQQYSDAVEEIDLFSRGDSFKISRFSVTKINENPMTSKNKASSLETVCTFKPLTAIRSMKAGENHSKGQINALYKNYASETTKTLTVTKIRENIAREDTAAFGKNLRNESTETSRLNVSKINENNAKEEPDVLRNICSNEKTKTSRFTVTKINENNAKEEPDVLRKVCSNEKAKTSRFHVTKIKENVAGEETSTFENKWRNENTKISRFTVTKIEENKSKKPVSILRKNLANETNKTSRFIVKKVSDDPLTSRASASLLRKSFPTNVSRFSVTKIDESETMLRGTINSSNEIFGDTENETVQFQENGSVKYQKRVSFSEIPFISFFQPYSSDDSPNSKNSTESLNENSPEEPRFLRDSTQSGPKEDISSTPTSRNVASPERQGLFRHHTFNASQTSNNNTQSSNTSIGLGRLSRMFRSNSGRSKNRGEKKK